MTMWSEHPDRPWADDQPFMGPGGEPAGRISPGLAPRLRKARGTKEERELWCCVHPDYLGQMLAPPPEVEAGFRDVMGERLIKEGQLSFLLRRHPIINRWCVYERQWHQGFGMVVWRVSWIICERPKSIDHVPEDLVGTAVEHLAGVVGDYCVPTKADFEWWASRYDRRRLSPTEIENMQFLHEQEDAKEAERVLDDQTHDFCSYYGRLAMDGINQSHGSCHRTMSFDDVTTRALNSPMRYEDRGGYKYKRTKREMQRWVLETLAALRGESVPDTEKAMAAGPAPIQELELVLSRISELELVAARVDRALDRVCELAETVSE